MTDKKKQSGPFSDLRKRLDEAHFDLKKSDSDSEKGSNTAKPDVRESNTDKISRPDSTENHQDAFHESMSDKDDEIRRLRELLSQAISDRDKIQEDLNLKELEIHEFSEHAEKMSSDLGEKKDIINDLENSLESKDAEYSELEKKYISESNRADKYLAANRVIEEKWKNKYQKIRNSLLDATERADKLLDKNKRLRKSANVQKKKVQEKDQQIQDHIKENESLARKNIRLNNKVEKLLDKRYEQKVLIESLQEEIAADRGFQINGEKIFNWLVDEEILHNPYDFDEISMVGDGPIYWDIIYEKLDNFGYSIWDPKHADTQVIIVGREDWSEQDLEEILETINTGSIRIYSQEMFIAGILAGKDPFDTEDETLLLSFAKGHPTLEYLMASGFDWPFIYTEILPDHPEFQSIEFAENSPLTELDYHVGLHAGLPFSDRKTILSKAFKEELPYVGSYEYMEEWGMPGTRKRLWRMSHHIAWLIRMRKNNPSMHYAVDDWQNDLDWLQESFYKKWMRFVWPETYI